MVTADEYQAAAAQGLAAARRYRNQERARPEPTARDPRRASLEAAQAELNRVTAQIAALRSEQAAAQARGWNHDRKVFYQESFKSLYRAQDKAARNVDKANEAYKSRLAFDEGRTPSPSTLQNAGLSSLPKKNILPAESEATTSENVAAGAAGWTPPTAPNKRTPEPEYSDPAVAAFYRKYPNLSEGVTRGARGELVTILEGPRPRNAGEMYDRLAKAPAWNPGRLELATKPYIAEKFAAPPPKRPDSLVDLQIARVIQGRPSPEAGLAIQAQALRSGNVTTQPPGTAAPFFPEDLKVGTVRAAPIARTSTYWSDRARTARERGQGPGEIPLAAAAAGMGAVELAKWSTTPEGAAVIATSLFNPYAGAALLVAVNQGDVAGMARGVAANPYGALGQAAAGYGLAAGSRAAARPLVKALAAEEAAAQISAGRLEGQSEVFDRAGGTADKAGLQVVRVGGRDFTIAAASREAFGFAEEGGIVTRRGAVARMIAQEVGGSAEGGLAGQGLAEFTIRRGTPLKPGEIFARGSVETGLGSVEAGELEVFARTARGSVETLKDGKVTGSRPVLALEFGGILKQLEGEAGGVRFELATGESRVFGGGAVQRKSFAIASESAASSEFRLRSETARSASRGRYRISERGVVEEVEIDRTRFKTIDFSRPFRSSGAPNPFDVEFLFSDRPEIITFIEKKMFPGWNRRPRVAITEGLAAERLTGILDGSSVSSSDLAPAIRASGARVTAAGTGSRSSLKLSLDEHPIGAARAPGLAEGVATQEAAAAIGREISQEPAAPRVGVVPKGKTASRDLSFSSLEPFGNVEAQGETLEPPSRRPAIAARTEEAVGARLYISSAPAFASVGALRELTATRTTPALRLGSSLRSASSERLGQSGRLALRHGVAERVAQESATRQETRAEQISALKTLTSGKAAAGRGLISSPSLINPPAPVPFLLRPPAPYAPGFDVFVKRGGVFRRINTEPLTKEAALFRGAFAADNSAAATFKLAEAGPANSGGALTPAGLRGLLAKFRKKKTGEFVELNAARISTFGEHEDITAKGILAKKIKGLKI